MNNKYNLPKQLINSYNGLLHTDTIFNAYCQVSNIRRTLVGN